MQTLHKILKADVAAEEAVRDFWRRRIVLATGCFDILHRGHVEMLERACDSISTNCGEKLWVGLNSDRAIRQLKGDGRPRNDYASRAVVMASLACVHRVFEIDDVRVAGAIRMVRPLAWVKGGDYTRQTLDQGEVAAADEVRAYIILIPTIGDYSTTKILQKEHGCQTAPP